MPTAVAPKPAKFAEILDAMRNPSVTASARKNGLDAIHDAVHEMAKDEARHGKALKGLLERYFK